VLQARGLFRREYEHETLRENLGLAIPGNRYTVARRAEESAKPAAPTTTARSNTRHDKSPNALG
jgi:hypothetical protein